MEKEEAKLVLDMLNGYYVTVIHPLFAISGTLEKCVHGYSITFCNLANAACIIFYPENVWSIREYSGTATINVKGE